ncbi:esterase FE4-like isoform X2 [Periplaneta americana]|uniref:esterase FE4-like isoform X2 n=1 Tax=Periplaneta americana TaxID=6978 RepID=UPI0037E7AE00
MIRTLFFLLFLSEVYGGRNNPLEITLKQGTLRGHTLTSRKGRDIFAFQSIPYAKPPLKELRFQPPQPPDPWKGVLDATVHSPICIQFWSLLNPINLTGTEDCLYLDVFTPRLPDNSEEFKSLDVIFCVPGGAYEFGNSFLFGSEYLLDKDVILVTINYRLGPLGFLSTNDAVCPGNNGLKDQVAALKWVRENIAEFGGNPDHVTIIGHSSGAAIAHNHMLSPASKGLFHRAISLSGTALNVWALAPPEVSKKNAKKLATALHCPTESSRELISCLKEKEAYDITKTLEIFQTWGTFPTFAFLPVVEKDVGEGDEAFIPVEPLKYLLTTKDVDLVPWIVGMTSGEGAFYIANIFNKRVLIEELNDRFDEIMPMFFMYADTSTPSAVKNITRQIREFYFGNKTISYDTIQAAIDMYGDAGFKHGFYLAAKLHAMRGAQVFYYEFDYRGTNSYSTNFGICRDIETRHLSPAT